MFCNDFYIFWHAGKGVAWAETELDRNKLPTSLAGSCWVYLVPSDQDLFHLGREAQGLARLVPLFLLAPELHRITARARVKARLYPHGSALLSKTPSNSPCLESRKSLSTVGSGRLFCWVFLNWLNFFFPFLLRNYPMIFGFRKFPLLLDLFFPLLSFILMSIPITPVRKITEKHLFYCVFSNRKNPPPTWKVGLAPTCNQFSRYYYWNPRTIEISTNFSWLSQAQNFIFVRKILEGFFFLYVV